MAKYNPIPMTASIYLRFLYHDLGLRGEALVPKLRERGFPPYSRRSILCHAKKPIFDDTPDQRKSNQGRPKKLLQWEERRVVSALKRLREQQIDFSLQHVQEEGGLQNEAVSTHCADA